MRFGAIATSTLFIFIIALASGCGDEQQMAKTRAIEPATRTTDYFSETYFLATADDSARGAGASMDMRKAVESYYLERGQRTHVMPPPISALRTVEGYELLWVGAIKSLDRELVYDPRTKRIVGKFSGGMPGDAVARASSTTKETQATTTP